MRLTFPTPCPDAPSTFCPSQLNHLLKSPFVVHPKTGRVCVPIDPRDPDSFTPFDVPTITDLCRWVARRQVGEGENDVGPFPGRRSRFFHLLSFCTVAKLTSMTPRMPTTRRAGRLKVRGAWSVERPGSDETACWSRAGYYADMCCQRLFCL